MKKSKVSASLITGFVAVLSLCACNEVTPSDSRIVTYKDYSTGEVSVNIDSFYDSYRNTTEGVNTIYDAVLESIIRYEYQSLRLDGKTDLTFEDLQKKATDNLKDKKEEAQKNSETNHTSYETEWNKILSSYDCEDENELYQHLLYDLEKTQVEDWYLKENYKANKSLISEFIGVNEIGASTTKEVASVYPYHIRHILFSVSDSATNYSDNVITEAEATNLWNIANELVDTDYSFGQIADKHSGDTGTAKEYGDIGIVTTTSEYIEEFKLGVYAYDAIFNPDHSATNTNIQSGLGVTSKRKGADNLVGAKTIEETFEQIGLATVPFRAFAAIGDTADLEKDSADYEVNDGNEHYFPRNVYWNLYCNLHQPFVVTDEALAKSDEDLVAAGILKAETVATFANIFGGSRFVPAEDLGLKEQIGDHKVLVDNKGRVVIGARGSYGIHFMIMHKSIYDFKQGGSATAESSLDEYYTPFMPGDVNYPKYNGVDKTDTFVSYYKNADTKTYSERSEKVKSAIRGFDSTYDYRLYLDFVGDSSVTFRFNGVEDKNLGTKIAKMIENKQKNNLSSRGYDLQNSWTTYIERIEAQNADRIEAIMDPAEPGKATNDFRLIPEGCAIGFKNTTKGAEWDKGGYCYYAK